MKLSRYLLFGVALCATMVVGTQAALAKTWEVATTNEHGHAEFSLTEVGGVSDDPPVGSVRACDDDKDGAGVVVFVLAGDSDNVLLAEAAESRGGDGTCGRPEEVATTDQDSFKVRVCQHDKSEDGGFGDPKDPDSAFSSVLSKCDSEVIG